MLLATVSAQPIGSCRARYGFERVLFLKFSFLTKKVNTVSLRFNTLFVYIGVFLPQHKVCFMNCVVPFGVLVKILCDHDWVVNDWSILISSGDGPLIVADS